VSRAGLSAAVLAALLFAGVARAEFYVEEITGDGVLNPADFSWRYYAEQMQRFPERLGFICMNAYELDKTGNHQQSFQFFSECAQRGNAASMIYLAHLYEQGFGVPANAAHATAWLRRAAETGYSLAQYHYGIALLLGRGVAKDRVAAEQWLRRAAAQDDAGAIELIANSFNPEHTH